MRSEGPPSSGERQLGHQTDPVASHDVGGNPQFAGTGCLPGCSANAERKGDKSSELICYHLRCSPVKKLVKGS